LEAAGTPIGAMDMMIAAQAKSIKAVLYEGKRTENRQLNLIQ